MPKGGREYSLEQLRSAWGAGVAAAQRKQFNTRIAHAEEQSELAQYLKSISDQTDPIQKATSIEIAIYLCITLPRLEKDVAITALRKASSGVMSMNMFNEIVQQAIAAHQDTEQQDAALEALPTKIIAKFIAECCAVHVQQQTGSTVLYDAYIQWCGVTSPYHMSKNMFGRCLRQLGYVSKHTNRGSVYVGLILKRGGNNAQRL